MHVLRLNANKTAFIWGWAKNCSGLINACRGEAVAFSGNDSKDSSCTYSGSYTSCGTIDESNVDAI